MYKLLTTLKASSQNAHYEYYAIFVSNPHRQVPFWSQNTQTSPDSPVVWDYHVFLLQKDTSNMLCCVWDFDAKLPFPCPLEEYVNASLRPQLMQHLPPSLHRRYRVVPAADLFQHFASDRSHMKTASGGWASEPPAYACIKAEDGSTMTLPAFIDMSIVPGSSSRYGTVLSETHFLSEFLP